KADNIEFYFDGNYEHQFNSAIDNGSDFTVDSLTLDLSATMPIDTNLKLSVQVAYSLDFYDFGGGTAFAGSTDPWDTIHTISIGALLDWGMSDDVTIFGGPLLQSARESGADFGDSLSGGGVIGFKYRVSDDLTAGLGVGVFSRIEDEIKAYPIFVLDWRFSDDFRFSTTAGAGAFGRAGIELIWDTTDKLELALGAGYELKRFRLDDSGVASGGVGETSSIPAWIRANYKISNDVNVGAMFGFHFSGEIKIENDRGGNLNSQDYDTTPLLSVYFTIHF
ncbi:MAG TPA: hypothetical protein VG711_09960, partial [Phycisphaerales bacterium]|nr:hypothetical protein [Phycisphaerales bacterium]